MDTGLVIRAQQGDEAAFASLASALYERLHTIAHGVLRDPSLADDAIQQALLAIWRELPRLRDPARIEAWSYRLVVNACHAEARRSRRWIPGLALGVQDGATASVDIDTVVDRDQLERGFRRLSVDHRAVMVLHHYLDLSPTEIAASLSIPLGTVQSRLHHAKRALRAALDADARSTTRDDVAPEASR